VALMPVDRCVCHEVSFTHLIPIVERCRAEGISDENQILDQLRAQTGCTTGCSLCEPYIRQMIRTGQTRFDPLSFPHE